MPDYATLLADATQLSLVGRIRLIEALWDTLPEDAMPPLSDEWLAEIQHRSAEYDSGTVTPIPWERIRIESLNRLHGAE